MNLVLRKRRHNFDELCKFLGKQDLFFLTAVLRDDFKQILLILILSDYVEMPYQSQHYFLDISFSLFVQLSYYFDQLLLISPKVQAF